jgi:hypothetical protein
MGAQTCVSWREQAIALLEANSRRRRKTMNLVILINQSYDGLPTYE